MKTPFLKERSTTSIFAHKVKLTEEEPISRSLFLFCSFRNGTLHKNVGGSFGLFHVDCIKERALVGSIITAKIIAESIDFPAQKYIKRR